MKSNLNLKTVYDSLSMRLAIAAGIMLIGLTLINAAKIHRFTPFSYAIFVLPYLAYFCLIYFGYRATLAQRSYRWLGYGLIVTAVLSSYAVVKYYFYDLVPQFMDGFTAPWLPEHKPVLIGKIIGGLLIFIIIYVVDYLAWEWYFIRVEFRLAEAKIQNISNVQLLSGHFLGNVYDLLRPRSKRIRSSILNFFQYVSNKIANPKVLVPVQEEWSYVKQLISFCTHRNFIVEGEELLDRKLLNRSIPTLTIMSWIENAVKYSPEDPNEYIELKWIKVVGGTQLQIRNRIAADNIEKGTGKGLALVNKLFDSMKNQLIVLEYEIVDAKYFIVKLTFKH
jgi:hypothetical protein